MDEDQIPKDDDVLQSGTSSEDNPGIVHNNIDNDSLSVAVDDSVETTATDDVYYDDDDISSSDDDFFTDRQAELKLRRNMTERANFQVLIDTMMDFSMSQDPMERSSRQSAAKVDEDERGEQGAVGGEDVRGNLAPEDKKNGEGRSEDFQQGGNMKQMKKCFSCEKRAEKMKHCGGCKKVTYCDQHCQKEDWTKKHKRVCAIIRRYSEIVDKADMLRWVLERGPCNKLKSLESVMTREHARILQFRHPGMLRPKRCVFLEIVGPYHYPHRDAYSVRDINGDTTHVVFYIDPFLVKLKGMPVPLPLEKALRPGLFICLVDPVWHHFLDGTVGIRINDSKEFELL